MFSKFRSSQTRTNPPLSPQEQSNRELERWLREDVLGLDRDVDDNAESTPATSADDQEPGNGRREVA